MREQSDDRQSDSNWTRKREAVLIGGVKGLSFVQIGPRGNKRKTTGARPGTVHRETLANS